MLKVLLDTFENLLIPLGHDFIRMTALFEETSARNLK